MARGRKRRQQPGHGCDRETRCHVRWSVNPQDGLHRIHDTFDADIWDAIRRIFDRTWWKRLWVYREVVLARQVSLLCGDTSIDSTRLSQARALCVWLLDPRYRHSYLPFSSAAKVQAVVYHSGMNFLHEREVRTQDHGFQLPTLSLLRHCISRECTYWRDRIYAVVGLARDAGGFGDRTTGSLPKSFHRLRSDSHQPRSFA
jgi:hypothetical protein